MAPKKLARIPVPVTRMILTKIARGTADKQMIIRFHQFLSIRYAKRKLNIIKDVIDLRPEHASATSSCVLAKYSMFPSRKDGMERNPIKAWEILVAKICNGKETIRLNVSGTGTMKSRKKMGKA